MAYAAEEVGLRGSADIAAQHRNANANVVGVLQLDMTNYKGSPTVDFALVTDRTNAAQNTFVGQLIDTYLGLPRVNTQCGYACSDHASWNTQGYAASFPHEAPLASSNPFIHTANDTLAQSGNNANHALKFSKLAGAYLAELAKGGFGGGGNLPPTANAGADQSRARGRHGHPRAAAAAIPTAVPVPLTYAWSQVAGPSVTISEPDPGDGQRHARDGGRVRLPPDGERRRRQRVRRRRASRSRARAAPPCSTPRCRRRSARPSASSCDTGASLVLGRDGRGPEPNQPNTINDACADGTSGTFHVDESNDRVRVFTTDGTSFAPGKTVRIEATVWAWTTPAAGLGGLLLRGRRGEPDLDAHRHREADGGRRADAVARPTRCPPGALQAVRVQYRYQGSATACASGGYNDRDDLVFAVTSAPVTTVFSDNFETATGWTANPNGTDTATAGPLGARRPGGDHRQRRQAARHDRQRRRTTS